MIGGCKRNMGRGLDWAFIFSFRTAFVRRYCTFSECSSARLELDGKPLLEGQTRFNPCI